MSSLVAIMQRGREAATETTYPFLILHDPEEKVCLLAGAALRHGLQRKSQAGLTASLNQPFFP